MLVQFGDDLPGRERLDGGHGGSGERNSHPYYSDSIVMLSLE
jgi:hypothetical protein